MSTKMIYYVAGKGERWHIMLRYKGGLPMVYATYNSAKNATKAYARLRWIDKEWLEKT